MSDSEARGPFNNQASIVDLIKQEAQELADVSDVYIPVKGYESTGLRIKYRMPESGKELDTIARKVFRETKDTFTRNLNITLDTMAHLCDGLYVLHPDNPELDPVELDPNLQGHPVGFDETAAALFGLNGNEPHTARQIIKKIFGGKDLAILSHGEKLSRWLNDSKANIDAEVWEMGEL